MCSGAAKAYRHRAALLLVFSALALPWTLYGKTASIRDARVVFYFIRGNMAWFAYGGDAQQGNVGTLDRKQNRGGIVVSLSFKLNKPNTEDA